MNVSRICNAKTLRSNFYRIALKLYCDTRVFDVFSNVEGDTLEIETRKAIRYKLFETELKMSLTRSINREGEKICHILENHDL